MNKPSAPTDATKRAVAYFHASQEYFWRWAEQEAVVEWKNGATICYRQELAQLLTELAPSGLPTLSTLLLLLAACQGSWQKQMDSRYLRK
ncbi:hypothetical protein [Hymenobacter sp. AT01-02]|uniref:hypothetical protein n=1 Tax=Hymenobacter sp. AT01-02 TaxID=1571877 RepID=UPI0006E26EC3|nr:hypothetical protein [Hymenobacter sp. AT01-02]